eukprot:COSAG02_NODE_6195_length_3739_cov_2.131044_1_plen_40_part_00
MGFVEKRVVVKNLSVTLFQSVTLQSFSHTCEAMYLLVVD